MKPIKQLSNTDTATQLVQRLFTEIITIDNDQRRLINNNQEIDFAKLNKDNESIFDLVDSLELCLITDSSLTHNVIRIKDLLIQRKKILDEYISLKHQLSNDHNLTHQINQLYDFVNYYSIKGDSSLYTQKNKINKSTYEEIIEDTTHHKYNLIERLLGIKKTNTTKEINHYILESNETLVDTLTLKIEDSIISQFTKTIASLQTTRQNLLSNTNNKQSQFERANNNLLQEVLSILNAIQQETQKQKFENNLFAEKIIDDGLRKNNIILISFVVLTVILGSLIFLDLVKSNQYRKQLIAAKEEAEKLSLAKQQFLANMSHELRTPLQSILGFSEIISEDQNKHQHANSLKLASQHLLDVVNQILDFSTIQKKGINIENRNFYIKDVIKEVTDLMKFQAQNKGLTFTDNVEEMSNDFLFGDPFKLKQILINLLNNAIKYTDKGTVGLMIKPTHQSESVDFLFKVFDTGIGFDEVKRDIIFDEFEQLDSEHQSSGTGLGLHIVKRIINRLNGSISVKSKPNEGSSFEVKINYTKAQGNLPISEINNIDKDKKYPLVWLVDDDPLIVSYCSILFNKNNVPYQAFSNPLQLLNEPLNDQLRIIFMDIRMPLMNGFELKRALIEKGLSHKTKIIAITAHISEIDKDSILTQGFDHVVHKPFSKDELFTILNQYSSSFQNTVKLNDVVEDDIYGVFIESSKNDLKRLLEFVQSKDVKEIMFYAHKFSGRLQQMGYSELGKKFRKVELLIKNNQSYNELLNQCIHELKVNVLDSKV